jgi:hypothetical protein
MKRLGLVVAVVAGLTGCALPFAGHNSPAVSSFDSGASDVVPAKPIVQVRSYWRSSVVTIVAWDPEDPMVGLRTSVSRSGKLVGGLRVGDHSLYMTPLYAQNMGGIGQATVPPGELLLGTGVQRDSYACRYGKECSPMVTLGVRVPDSTLRAYRDSFVVTFIPHVLDPWTLTLRRELIDVYLDKVDAVLADMRRTASN